MLRRDEERTIDLRGANLNGVRFEKSSAEACNLEGLYLPGILGEGTVFDGCTMTHAVFNNAVMPGATFSSCMLDTANFSKANLKGAQFHENILSGLSFYGSDLSKSSVRGGFFVNVNLANADLHQSDISNEFLFAALYNEQWTNDLANARLPNGSFIDIDSSNLFENFKYSSTVGVLEELSVFISPVSSVLPMSNCGGSIHRALGRPK